MMVTMVADDGDGGGLCWRLMMATVVADGGD
jgi:hypothetical protein